MFRTALQLARLATAAVTGVVEATVSTITGTTTTDEAPTVADPADVFAEDEMPAAEDIAAAAAQYAAAADLARAGARGKNAAKKVLSRLPAGRYGLWLVERVATSRETVDLDGVRALLKAHGYTGPVPMKSVAPSLKVSKAPADMADLGPAADAHMTALAAEHPAALVAA
ncbi:hypothetical protein ACIQK6_13750 [Streptomyces sp. NPDC091682]|uniref:hypothetical protein n=1 Tax=Streptomyces sp. NPDC091682 TaxID=3366005 RepID=UPI003824127C